MPTYGSKWPVYKVQWDGMSLKAAQLSEINATAKRLVAAKARYQVVEKATGVPWWWIACVHEREASQSWSASLAQGDPWNRVSTHVPRGRGPFPSWEAAAIDALKLDGVTKVVDWRLEKALYYWELYNGWGYFNHGVPSPYVWGATSVQRPGKYVSDGVWSSTATDKQLGCAAMLKAMMKLDPSINPARETAGATPEPVPPVQPLKGTRWIQDSLNRVTGSKLDVDGDYGPQTIVIVKAYQSSRRLVVDGKWGDKTSAAMDADLAKLKPVAAAVVAPTKSWWRRMLGM